MNNKAEPFLVKLGMKGPASTYANQCFPSTDLERVMMQEFHGYCLAGCLYQCQVSSEFRKKSNVGPSSTQHVSPTAGQYQGYTSCSKMSWSKRYSERLPTMETFPMFVDMVRGRRLYYWRHPPLCRPLVGYIGRRGWSKIINLSLPK